MAIIFPPGNDGEKYTVGGIVYEYSDGAWRLSSDNAKASIHVGTEPPSNPQQGDLWWHSGEADLKIYYVDSTSSQWVPASSPPDPYEENFVSISGDKMTGRLNMQQSAIRLVKEDGTVQFNMSPNNSDYFTNIYSFNCAENEGGMRFRVTPGNDTAGYKTVLAATFTDNPVGSTTQPVKTELNWLKTPTLPHHAANKQYVDDAVDTSNELPAAIPGRRFKYSNSYGDNLANGTFHIEGNGAIQISRFDSDGTEIATTGRDDFSSGVKFMVTVRNTNGQIVHSMASSSWYQGQGSKYYIKYSQGTSIKNGKGGMVVGNYYYIADGIYCV